MSVGFLPWIAYYVRFDVFLVIVVNGLMHSLIFVFVFRCSFGVLLSFGKYLFLTSSEKILFERH